MTFSPVNNSYQNFPNNLRKLFGLRSPETPLFELIINNNKLGYIKKKRKKDLRNKKRNLLLRNKQKRLQKQKSLKQKQKQIQIQIQKQKRLDAKSKNKINRQLMKKLDNFDQEIDADLEQLFKNF
ncbi:hypothetical protein M0813_11687 [Anaeramoeba flamelloides]|uniref:Uncharacterized protein n=1 Tax=Anaeramoeba flamelloides TaxID=1746091 RepID=A0ABQ8ZEL4_9EUKA|nr:hypothetical protein M0813_11687 [Anaeramoeba flamelloides]